MLEVMKKYIKYAMITHKLSLCIEYCNIRDQWSFINEWNKCISDIDDLINEVSYNSTGVSDNIRSCEVTIHDNIKNYMLCASIIEEEVMPLVCDILNNIEINLPESESYEIVKTKSGLLTLRDRRSNKYLHSLSNPMTEALRHSEYLYRVEAEDILICGAGLGYLPYQLWLKSYKSAHIYILENNPKAIELAKVIGVLDWIDENNLTIICEADDGLMFDSLASLPIDFDKAICWVSDYFIDNIADEGISASIVSLADNVITRERFRIMEGVNLRLNSKNTLGDISVLKEKENSLQKEYIVIAAGPSLDENIEYIKANRTNKKIIAVESSVRNLLKNGIRPDYIAVLDPTELIMKYIDGIEDNTADLVLVAYEKAYWRYIESFKGEKYRIISATEKDMDDIHSRVLNCTTVASLAIEIALYLGAESIDLIGVDLAYPNHKLYSSDVSNINKISSEVMVRSVDGAMVGSSNIFLQFKSEIEEIIRNSGVRFTNLSRNGAFIQGALMNKWWEKTPKDYIDYLKLLNEDSSLEWSEKYYILWQTISKYLEKEHDEDDMENSCFWNETAKVFNSLSKEFTTLVGNGADKGTTNEKYVVLLTSFYATGPDEISDKVRSDAYNLKINHGFDVLIVNTKEYMGGKKVAMEKYNNLQLEDNIVNSEAIFFMGERFPYFSFEDGMPDVLQTRSFLNAFARKVPISFVAYDTLSLVASACKLIGTVEYR